MSEGVAANDDFVADINVTPFVDVMLVLLIIFMVTAPMMTEGLDVDLPKVETTETLPTESDHTIITIKADGTLFFDEYQTTIADLGNVLAVQIQPTAGQLFIRADESVNYGTVMQVMGKIRAAGVQNVGMITVSGHTNVSASPSESTHTARPMSRPVVDNKGE